MNSQSRSGTELTIVQILSHLIHTTTLEVVPLIVMIVLLLFSHQVMFDSLQPHGRQHPRLPCPSPSHGACPCSCRDFTYGYL